MRNLSKFDTVDIFSNATLVEPINDGFGKDVSQDAYFDAEDEVDLTEPVRKTLSPPLEFVRGKPLVPYSIEDNDSNDDEEEEMLILKAPIVKKKILIKPIISSLSIGSPAITTGSLTSIVPKTDELVSSSSSSKRRKTDSDV